MKKETIDLYAPKNASSLTQEQVIAMQSFSKEELEELADAHPNTGTRGAYLVLYDKSKPKNKQLFSLSTWKNLLALHRLGQTQFVAYSFKNIFNRKNETSLPTAPVQDLTTEQARNELKTAGTQKAVKSEAPAMKKSAEQIAEEEGVGMKDSKKPLAEMSHKELTEEYEEVFGKAPAKNLSKAKLTEAIAAKK